MKIIRMSRAWYGAPLAALLWALGSTLATAQDSLADKRLAITKGTAPGKVLIEAPGRDPSASAAASAASGAGAAAPPRAGLFSRLPPPSGRPLNETRRLNSPDLGIRLPTAASRAASAAP